MNKINQELETLERIEKSPLQNLIKEIQKQQEFKERRESDANETSPDSNSRDK
jgi:hypothetical protein